MGYCRKVKFVDAKSADEYIVLLNTPGKKRLVTPRRSYYCYECKCWHITSKMNREMKTKEDFETKIKGLNLLVEDLRKEVKEGNRRINELNHLVKELRDKNKGLKKELGIWDSLKDI